MSCRRFRLCIQPTLRRPCSLIFRARVSPHPVPASAGTCFSFPSKRGVGAPGGAGEVAKLPGPALRSADPRQDSGTQVRSEGVEGPGARALARGPAPPGAPTRCQLSGTAFCSFFRRRDRRRLSTEQNRNMNSVCGEEVNPTGKRELQIPGGARSPIPIAVNRFR
jgi:hypothetical protein